MITLIAAGPREMTLPRTAGPLVAKWSDARGVEESPGSHEIAGIADIADIADIRKSAWQQTMRMSFANGQLPMLIAHFRCMNLP